MLTNWPPSLHRSSTDLWSCAKFPAASNAPPSFPSAKSPKSLALTTTDLSLSCLSVMKSLEKLVLAYLKDITRPLLDPLQFAYRENRFVDDAIIMGLHYILQHLYKPGNNARIVFVDFSSAFNTIMPDLLSEKLTQLSVPTSICQWITSFLTDRQQQVRLGKLTSRTLTVSTGTPQGCILSPLLFSFYNYDCTSKDPSVKLLKFADDTTIIGLIKDSGLQEEPTCTPPTHHHWQHCGCSRVIQIPGNHRLSWPEVGQSTADSQKCSEDYRCPSAQPQRTLPLQSEGRAKKVTLDPSHPAYSLWTVDLWPTLQSTEHQNSQTQEQFFPPGHIPPEPHITHPGTLHL